MRTRRHCGVFQSSKVFGRFRATWVVRGKARMTKFYWLFIFGFLLLIKPTVVIAGEGPDLIDYLEVEPLSADVDVDELPQLEQWEMVIGNEETARQLAQVLLVLEQQAGSDNYPASYHLVNLIESIARDNVTDFYNQNEYQRKAAEGLLDLTLESAAGQRIPASVKEELRAMVQSRFNSPQEHLMAASILELKRRKALAESGWKAVAPQMIHWADDGMAPKSAVELDQAQLVFEQNLTENLSVHPSQRNTFLRFWNVTEQSFNQFQMDCPKPAACRPKFEELLTLMRTREQIDSDTRLKLVAIYDARAASDSQLRFLNREEGVEKARAEQLSTIAANAEVDKLVAREVAYLASTTLTFGALNGNRLPRLIFVFGWVWLASGLFTVPWKKFKTF